MNESHQMTTNELGGRQSKLDTRFDLLPAAALRRIAEIFAVGAEKYGDDNWRRITITEHLNHALTHLNRLMDTRSMHLDEEDHLANAACRLLMALEIRQVGLDVTPKSEVSPMSDLLKAGLRQAKASGETVSLNVSNPDRTQLERDIETVKNVAEKVDRARRDPNAC